MAHDMSEYDYDYDQNDVYEDALETGHWIQRNGSRIHISQMTSTHLFNTINVCKRAQYNAVFENQKDVWQQWVEVLETELQSRKVVKPIESAKPKAPVRGSVAKMKCACGTVYLAREADLTRGWAKSCSKSCAAIRRDYGRPAATRVKE